MLASIISDIEGVQALLEGYAKHHQAKADHEPDLMLKEEHQLKAVRNMVHAKTLSNDLKTLRFLFNRLENPV